MRILRKWIRNVFGFSGNEINGFLILIPILLVLVFSEPLYELWFTTRPRHYGDFQKLDSLASLWEAREPVPEEHAPPARLFEFDPNSATIDELRALGFSRILANRIAAYRRKGGVFRTKADLLKIYALDSALFSRLYGYISLPERGKTTRRTTSTRVKTAVPAASARKKSLEAKKVKFDINSADTAVLKGIRGIGPTLAARILKFRDGLGGFVAPQQLFEVYGLDSPVVVRLSAVCFIEPDFSPRKININTATEPDLSRHPYIDRRLARLLVAYRFQHGDFREVGDIKKLSVLKPDEINRLLPYIKVED